MLQTYLTFFKQASPTLLGLIGLSVVALAIGIEKLVLTWRWQRRLRSSRQQLLAILEQGHAQLAQALCKTMPEHPALSLLSLLITRPGALALPESRRLQNRLIRKAKRRLWILASVGALAPFIGLFGTVLGVMEAFRAIAVQGGGGFQVVSAGISEALITTAVGILVGVEAVLLFNYLQVRVAYYTADVRETAEEVAEAASTGDLHVTARS